MKQNVESKWHVVYTKPRCEKQVYDTFLRKGITSYCPTTIILKRYTDRYKKVEEVLFKSYVFVKVAETEKLEVRLSHNVLNFVYSNGKPAIVTEEEINTIRRFLGEYENVRLEPMEFAPKQNVLVTSGPFMDQLATVVKVRKHLVEVELISLSVKMVAVFDKDKLAIL
jgi:transcription antitermination factor NusG